MDSIISRLQYLISRAAPSALSPSDLVPALSPEHLRGQFDLSWPVGFLLATKMKGQRPLDLAQQTLRQLPSNDLIQEASVAPPAYLNIRLNQQAHRRIIEEILTSGSSYPQQTSWQKRGAPPSALLEFCSANPTGPLHFGHARGAILGDTLARLLRHCGARVTTEYYINDIGRQVELLGQSLIARYHEKISGAQAPPAAIPPDGYGGDYLIKIAQELPADLNTADSEFFQNFAKNKILSLIRQDLDRLHISFDRWLAESEIHAGGGVTQTLQRLDKEGHAQIKDGALWFVAQGLSDEDKERVLRRWDGRTTYFASDLAYHEDKLRREQNLLINIWGADHHGYVARMRLGLEALGHDPKKLSVILVQMVRLLREGKPLTLSKRGGDYVTLGDIAAECGEEALRFFMNSRSPNAQLDFDLDLAKKQAPENPVYLIQYAHARIASIIREKAARNINWPNLVQPTELFEDDPKSRELSCHLALMPETILTSVNRLSPHYLAAYLIDLARLFHGYYETHPVLSQANAALARSRFDLCLATRQVIANGLGLLGISAPEKM
ncbi:MAG: arginine--tRNA ligase [Elusimicrobia bacterium]|nr:arginine--tRNA ligase [Elusimicrobiota bacterium]